VKVESARVPKFKINRRLILDEGKRLRLYFEDGMVRDVDLIAESKRGPAFRALKDPNYVKGVRRIWDGYLLEWPDKVTWSAEVLRNSGTLVKQAARPNRRTETTGEPRAAKVR
jgi:Protein of unknown function (DUF2442)